MKQQKETGLSDETKIKLILMLSVIVMGLTYFVLFSVERSNYHQELNEIEINMDNMKRSYIAAVFASMDILSNEKAEDIAEQLRIAIQHEYPNLNELQSEFTSKNLNNTQFTRIVYDTIKNSYLLDIHSDGERIFILVEDGFIVDGDLKKYGKPWHYFMEDKDIDGDLFFQKLTNLKNNDSGFTPYSMKLLYSNSPRRVLTVDKSKADILEQFNYKPDRFKDVEFYGYSFITQDGDIFGTPDVSANMQPNHNHKIVVIQKYNLYEALTFGPEFKAELDKIYALEDVLRSQVENHNHVRVMLYIIILAINIFLDIVIFITFHIAKKK